MQNKSNAKAS